MRAAQGASVSRRQSAASASKSPCLRIADREGGSEAKPRGRVTISVERPSPKA